MKILKSLVLILGFGLLNVFAQEIDKPKNIIILIGDGMGTNHVSAAVLNFPDNPFVKFNSVGLSITRAANKLVTDSAPGATVFSTGCRTNYRYIGVDTAGHRLTTLFELADKRDVATGIVVTCDVTHATPAAFVSHVVDRGEQDEIARQFLSAHLDLVIGGGAKHFRENHETSKVLNLIDSLKTLGYDIFTNYESLNENESSKKFYALLDDGHLHKADNRNYSLTDLTNKALSVLSENENGFILMVEGSQIDWGSHENNQEYMMSELKDFCGAVNTSLDFAEKDGNTLVLVTADHETGGVSIIDGTPDGTSLTLKFSTNEHTAGMVGVFAKGPGEELFRGVYDNFMIGRHLFQLVDPDYHF